MFKHKISIVPIIGVSQLSQLKENLKSLEVELSDQDFELMENAAFNQKEYIDNEEVSLV